MFLARPSTTLLAIATLDELYAATVQADAMRSSACLAAGCDAAILTQSRNSNICYQKRSQAYLFCCKVLM